ncbi:MAG: aminotransferase class IV [Phycisphaerales bacterium]
MTIWLNGELFDKPADARISAFDAGVQHGVGLFETMAARHGVVRFLDRHLERLAQSLSQLNLSHRLQSQPLAAAVNATLAHSGLPDARIRLTITGGDLNLRSHPPAPAPGSAQVHDPTIMIHVQLPTPYPNEFFANGVLATIAVDRVNPLDRFASHKTLNYWPRLSALTQAATAGASESLWFTTHGELAGGSVSNVFLVDDGRLCTPPARGDLADSDETIPAYVLPGITRSVLLDHARACGIEIHIAPLRIDELLAAEEVFLTNASWGVLPVVAVEQHQVGDGKPGPVTQQLRELWLGAAPA